MSLVIVIKIGTSSICDEKTFIPKLANLSLLVETVAKLRELGHSVILVTSGAVGMGLRTLKLTHKPKHIPQIQGVAAVGQGKLMALYDSLFSQFHIPIAQVLLTRDNLSDRSQYLNACNTFRELLAMSVVPIVNENDTVSHAEIRFGDNDSLSAIASGMVKANYLFLLTDVDCLYTDNPRTNPSAEPIHIVHDIAALKQSIHFTSAGSSIGTGGMITKLIAAELASSAGVSMIITKGSSPQDILEILDQVTQTDFESNGTLTKGTYFIGKKKRQLEDRKWWIQHGLSVYGSITIDAGAVKAIQSKGSLFAAGIIDVQGQFSSQQCVKIIYKQSSNDTQFQEIAKGIVNYSSTEISRIKGCKSHEIEQILGYSDSEEIIHRNNLAIVELC